MLEGVCGSKLQFKKFLIIHFESSEADINQTSEMYVEQLSFSSHKSYSLKHVDVDSSDSRETNNSTQ